MKSATTLERLPEIEFPSGLRDRMSFDPARKRLMFEGFMTKADYDRLRVLSQDADYLLALEELFERSAYESWTPLLPIPKWVWFVACFCLAGGALFWLVILHRVGVSH